MDQDHCRSQLNKARTLPENCRLTDNPLELAQDPDIDVVVELMGGKDTARTLIRESLLNGKHVVTANKALLAEHGEELFALASEHGTFSGYEASVAGAIPIVQTLQRESCGKSTSVSDMGVLNGTATIFIRKISLVWTCHRANTGAGTGTGRGGSDSGCGRHRRGPQADSAHPPGLGDSIIPSLELSVQGIRGLRRMVSNLPAEFGYRINCSGWQKKLMER